MIMGCDSSYFNALKLEWQGSIDLSTYTLALEVVGINGYLQELPPTEVTNVAFNTIIGSREEVF